MQKIIFKFSLYAFDEDMCVGNYTSSTLSQYFMVEMLLSTGAAFSIISTNHFIANEFLCVIKLWKSI